MPTSKKEKFYCVSHNNEFQCNGVGKRKLEETEKWGHGHFQPQRDHKTPSKQQPIQWITTSVITTQGQAGQNGNLPSASFAEQRAKVQCCLLSSEAFLSKSRCAGILEIVEIPGPPAAHSLTAGKYSGKSRFTLLRSPCKHVVTVPNFPNPALASFIPSATQVNSKGAGSVAQCVEC